MVLRGAESMAAGAAEGKTAAAVTPVAALEVEAAWEVAVKGVEMAEVRAAVGWVAEMSAATVAAAKVVVRAGAGRRGRGRRCRRRGGGRR